MSPIQEVVLVMQRELRKNFRSVKGIVLLTLSLLGGGGVAVEADGEGNEHAQGWKRHRQLRGCVDANAHGVPSSLLSLPSCAVAVRTSMGGAFAHSS